MMFRKKDVIDLTSFKKISDDNIVFISGNLIITKKDDKVINSSKSLKKDDLLEVEFQDGVVQTKVI